MDSRVVVLLMDAWSVMAARACSDCGLGGMTLGEHQQQDFLAAAES